MNLTQSVRHAFGESSSARQVNVSIAPADFFAPASIITFIGLGLCLIGSLYLDQWLGLTLIAIGRACDLLDGPVARASGVTHLNLILDPIADKTALLAIMIGCWYFGLVPAPILAYILIVHGAISVVSIIAERRGTATGAAIAGKLHLFCHNATLLAYIIRPHVSDALAHVLIAGAKAVLLLSIPLAMLTLRSYVRQIR